MIQSHPFVIASKLIKERLSQDEGFNKISITLIKNYKLEVFEYYNETKGVTKYRYQLLDNNNVFIARWDNAPHHTGLSTYPDHYHISTVVKEFYYESLQKVLDGLDKFW